MFKAIILGCTICAGAGGTAIWVKSGGNAAANSNGTPATSVSPISIQEMHSNAHLDGLPVQVVQDLY